MILIYIAEVIDLRLLANLDRLRPIREIEFTAMFLHIFQYRTAPGIPLLTGRYREIRQLKRRPGQGLYLLSFGVAALQDASLAVDDALPVKPERQLIKYPKIRLQRVLFRRHRLTVEISSVPI